MPYFQVTLRDAVDDDGLTVEPFHFKCVDEFDAVLDHPWIAGVSFSAPPDGTISLGFQDLDAEGYFADYCTSPVPMVSERFKIVLEEAGAGLAYYPVSIANADGFEDCPTYFAFNVPRARIAVANAALTQSSKAFGQTGADLIETAVARNDMPQDVVLFRSLENASKVYVNQQIVERCAEVGIDTLTFTKL